MTRYRLDLDQCPPALRDELTAYIKWCEAPIARNRDRRVAKRPTTSKKSPTIRCCDLAGFTVNTLHQPAESLTLRGLCQPDLIEAFINWWFTERYGKMTAGLEQYLLIPKTIARHWLKDVRAGGQSSRRCCCAPCPHRSLSRKKAERWLTLAQPRGSRPQSASVQCATAP